MKNICGEFKFHSNPSAKYHAKDNEQWTAGRTATDNIPENILPPADSSMAKTEKRH